MNKQEIINALEELKQKLMKEEESVNTEFQINYGEWAITSLKDLRNGNIFYISECGTYYSNNNGANIAQLSLVEEFLNSDIFVINTVKNIKTSFELMLGKNSFLPKLDIEIIYVKNKEIWVQYKDEIDATINASIEFLKTPMYFTTGDKQPIYKGEYCVGVSIKEKSKDWSWEKHEILPYIGEEHKPNENFLTFKTLELAKDFVEKQKPLQKDFYKNLKINSYLKIIYDNDFVIALVKKISIMDDKSVLFVNTKKYFIADKLKVKRAEIIDPSITNIGKFNFTDFKETNVLFIKNNEIELLTIKGLYNLKFNQK